MNESVWLIAAVVLYILAMKGQDEQAVARDRFHKGYREDD